MSRIDGIFVSLRTAGASWAGTDDPLYLGVVGTVGGREFSLDVADFNDFEEATTVTYAFGPGIRDSPYSGKEPITADEDLSDTLICLPNVTHVYLRKHGGTSARADDAYRLQEAGVALFAPSSPTRLFGSTGPATLGFEYGLTLWLAEEGPRRSDFGGAAFRDARIPVNGTAECAPGG